MGNKKLIRSFTVDGSLGFVEPFIPDLKKKYELQVLSSPGEKLNKVCSQYDIKGHAVYMFRRISLLNDLKSLWHIIRIFQKEKPYMVHSMTPKAGMLCMLASWLCRVPRRVHTFTGLVWPTATGIKRRILMSTDWITCACATHVIPEGKGVMNDLQQHITNKPMKVLGYGNIRGVDMHKFSRRPEIIKHAQLLTKKGVFTFIFVGRIVKDKGINELIDAFVKLNTKYPGTRLILVGKFESDIDPISDNAYNVIQSNPFIEAVGPQYGDDLLAYYASSDCMVLPSYREGFPNVVLEAGAMGLPSVVTNINGSREIIENEKNGLVVPSKDSEALFLAMERIMNDGQLRDTILINARQMIEDRFERSFVQKCLLDFYNEIV